MSAQCLYCQSVRAKNTSRQRAHLLECTHYLEAMKAHNPESPILHEAINGTPLAATPTPASKVPKKRDLDTMVNGFQGDSTSINRTWPIPKPTLERDFQMSVQLNPKISVGHGIWGQRNWISYISGHWNGRWGKGTVVVSYSIWFLKDQSSLDEIVATDSVFRYHSQAVKTLSLSLPIYPPISTPITCFKLTIILPPLSR